MPSGGVRVEGLAQLQRDLVSLGVELSDLKGVMAGLAEKGARVAASLAPRRSGKLAESIAGNRAPNAAIVRAGGRGVPYAGAINYGWRKHGIAPAHFMQRASEALRPQAVNDLQRGIDLLILQKGLA